MGSSNDVVYPVHGGMEEWGYAASWFNQHNPVHTVPAACDHNQSVVVTPTSHRCLTFLVETTDIKTPVQKLLGDSARLFATPVPKEGQYVPIVMRQALALMEAVRPYSVITASSTANHTLSVRWLVGGCFEVDDTRIVAIPATPEIEAIMDETYARGDLRDEEYALLLSAVRSPLHSSSQTGVSPLHSSSQKGVSPLHSSSQTGVSPLRNPLPNVDLSDDRNRLYFNATLPLPSGSFLVVAVSGVDAYMDRVKENVNPNVPPQSLFVSLRRNTTWRSEERVLRGRELVLSRPIRVVIADRTQSTQQTPECVLMKLESPYPPLPVLSWFELGLRGFVLLCLLFLLFLSYYSVCSTKHARHLYLAERKGDSRCRPHRARWAFRLEALTRNRRTSSTHHARRTRAHNPPKAKTGCRCRFRPVPSAVAESSASR